MKYKQQIEQKIQAVNTLIDTLENGMRGNQYSAAEVMALLANIRRQTEFIEERLELESQD